MLYPLLMEAPVKDYIWGGTRLRTKYNKQSEADRLAESWELSCHPAGPSLIANGSAQGKTLAEYIAETGKDILGTKAKTAVAFPIMIKLIDAKDNLSIQVHPDDAYALEHEKEYGKTEMWYVIDAQPGAQLIYGLEKEISRQELEQHLQQGTILDVCHHVPVKKGDVFFIPAGTIHAIGKGILLAEVQQNSNITYRLFDYNRPGTDGKPRQLHIPQGAAVSSLQPLPLHTEKKTVQLSSDCSAQLLASCKYFNTYSINLDSTVTLTADAASFHTFTLLEGEADVIHDETTLHLAAGQTVFIPAGLGEYTIKGKGELIFTTL